jgi:hypothetical protein
VSYIVNLEDVWDAQDGDFVADAGRDRLWCGFGGFLAGLSHESMHPMDWDQIALFSEFRFSADAEVCGLNRRVSTGLGAFQRDSVISRQYYASTIRVDLGD